MTTQQGAGDENKITTTTTLETLFKKFRLRIPGYQRAYAWESEQINTYISDLHEQIAPYLSDTKPYFLGTLLLQRTAVLSNGVQIADVVDGQQRLTTTVLFLAAALAHFALSSESTGIEQFAFSIRGDRDGAALSAISNDKDFFWKLISGETTVEPLSAAQVRMKDAYTLFLSEELKAFLPQLVNVLRKARVLVYVVENIGEATQLFELQNDRGKKLTDLEAIKSYLMHLVYIRDPDPNSSIEDIAHRFADIFRISELIEREIEPPDADSLLRYHLQAFGEWKDDIWRHPKRYARMVFESKTDTFELRKEILAFCEGIRTSFQHALKLLQARDRIHALGNLFALRRVAPFWPLLLRASSVHMKNGEAFEELVRAMEIFAFQGYAIGNMRSDGGSAQLGKAAREFKSLTQARQVVEGLADRYNTFERMVTAIDDPRIYLNDREDATYLLWRYENHLRAQTGNQNPKLSWQTLIRPDNSATSLSIEHIVAQSDACCNENVTYLGKDGKFSELALHSLGNLVIDTRSANSSKGADKFEDKLPKFLRTSFLSQADLKSFMNDKSESARFDLSAIKKRHDHIRSFCKETWPKPTIRQIEPTVPSSGLATGELATSHAVESNA